MQVNTMETIKERLGPMVKEQRKKLNTTQEELADYVGVTPGFIGQIERGEAMPSLDTLQRLITHLYLDLNALFFDCIQYDSDYSELISIMTQMTSHQRHFLLAFAKLLISEQLPYECQ